MENADGYEATATYCSIRPSFSFLRALSTPRRRQNRDMARTRPAAIDEEGCHVGIPVPHASYRTVVRVGGESGPKGKQVSLRLLVVLFLRVQLPPSPPD